MSEKVKTLYGNTVGRDYVVGDIHGCFSLLEAGLRKIKFDRSVDRLFLLGDLCDRGPESIKVLDYAYEDWFIPCYGNHEDLFVGYYRRDEAGVFFNNGGYWVHDLTPEQRLEICEYFETLPIAIEIIYPNKRVGLVHAEVPQSMSWDMFTTVLDTPEDEQPIFIGGFSTTRLEDVAIWARSRVKKAKYIGQDVEGVDAVYHGHSILGNDIRKSYCSGNVKYIDTGSYMHEDRNYGITIVDIKSEEEYFINRNYL